MKENTRQHEGKRRAEAERERRRRRRRSEMLKVGEQTAILVSCC